MSTAVGPGSIVSEISFTLGFVDVLDENELFAGITEVKNHIFAIMAGYVIELPFKKK